MKHSKGVVQVGMGQYIIWDGVIWKFYLDDYIITVNFLFCLPKLTVLSVEIFK